MKREPPKPFTASLTTLIRRTLYRQSVRLSVVDEALQRWQAGQEASDIPCEEEQKGKHYGVESLCRCSGCTTRKCFAFFEQVYKNFGPGE